MEFSPKLVSHEPTHPVAVEILTVQTQYSCCTLVLIPNTLTPLIHGEKSIITDG